MSLRHMPGGHLRSHTFVEGLRTVLPLHAEAQSPVDGSATMFEPHSTAVTQKVITDVFFCREGRPDGS